MNLTGSGVLAVAAVVAVAVAGVVIWRSRAALGQAINPADPQNVVNRGLTAAVSAAAGRDESLGGLLAEWLNPATRQVAAELRVPVRDVVTPADPGVVWMP